ncbi:MAG: hypothetical protein CL572_06820 [Alphaproteobacteria bacterium]|nr:hypothetical protein [Alphaproteobacteria bacterium]
MNIKTKKNLNKLRIYILYGLQMNKRLSTFFLGVITVIVLIELMFVERHSEKDGFYELFASFNKVDGVNPGDKIMVSGVSVGYVKEINLKKNYPLIRMKIKKKLNISDDSSVSIQTDGLFGSKFLMIEMGGTSNYMKNGDYFSFTEDSILIQDLLENIIKIGEKNQI